MSRPNIAEYTAGTAVLAYLHAGEVAESFHRSVVQLVQYDAAHNRRLVGMIPEQCGAGRIIEGRNDAVVGFLTRTAAEWLVFIDSDMGFDPDMIDRLIDAADPHQRPFVGALAFGQRPGGRGLASSSHSEQFPTIYRWVEGPRSAGVAPVLDYRRGAVVECDATGAACFVVHRNLLIAMANEFPGPRSWFDEHRYKGSIFGEDITFCLRVKALEVPIFVHTGVQTSHRKATFLTEQTQPALDQIPTYAVIPMKDRVELTELLVDELAEQGQATGILIFDNGSEDPATAERLTALAARWPTLVEVLPAAGLNIHQMWNLGLDLAAVRSWPANVAILNNDIRIGPNFLAGLAYELRRDPFLAVVSPNYDGRTADDPDATVQYVTEICANRYDGTGGLAGFAFMLPVEAKYRFPTDLTWWYGDNDMVQSVLIGGSRCGIVLGVTCEHINGGSQTAGDWSEIDPQVLENDRQIFVRKWAPGVYTMPAADEHDVSDLGDPIDDAPRPAPADQSWLEVEGVRCAR